MHPLIQSIREKTHWLFGPDKAEQVLPAANGHLRALQKLAKAQKTGKARVIRAAQHRVLTSRASKLVCLLQSLRPNHYWSWEQLNQGVNETDPWTDPGEAVQVHLKPKSSPMIGKFNHRIICQFGPRRTALQTLSSDIIRIRHGTDPVDFMQKGRGAEKAAEHIQNLIQEGFHHFVVADIANFYGSVQHECLEQVLGIPAQVLRTCALIPSEAPLLLPHSLSQYGVSFDVLTGMVRQGLPQGSRASTTIAGLLHGPTLRTITSADRIVVYGDDIAIAARDEGEANALMKALIGALASHPAGSFRLRRCTVQNVREGGLDFLKYLVTESQVTGEPTYRPANKCYARYHERCMGVPMSDDEIAAFLPRWAGAFPRWKPKPAALYALSQFNEQFAPPVKVAKE